MNGYLTQIYDKVTELSYGNINHTYLVEDKLKKYVVKYFPNYIRLLGEQNKLSQSRITHEIAFFDAYPTISPSIVRMDDNMYQMEYYEDGTLKQNYLANVNVNIDNIINYFLHPIKNTNNTVINGECMNLTKDVVFDQMITMFPCYKDPIDDIKNYFMTCNTDLIHGDLHLDSVMIKNNQCYFIDSEFSCYGSIEFDIGTFLAHIIILYYTQKNEKYLNIYFQVIQQTGYSKIMYQFIGIEILRRMYGIASTPELRAHKDKYPILDSIVEQLLHFSYKIYSKGLVMYDMFEFTHIFVLMQSKLPHIEKWCFVRDYKGMVELIKNLDVRGAPLIGTAGIASVYQHIKNNNKPLDISNVTTALMESRPTAIPIHNYLGKIQESYPDIDISNYLDQHIKHELHTYESVTEQVYNLIEENDVIMTICNTGEYTTIGKGTALGGIIKAKNKNITVIVLETRPLLQGSRLTSYELQQNNINHKVIVDGCAGFAIKQYHVTKVFVGADRILPNGDLINKIGTLNLAIIANHYQIPFYAVSTKSTQSTHNEYCIELRPDYEVSTYTDHIFNPAFDVTPNKYLTGTIVEQFKYYDRVYY